MALIGNYSVLNKSCGRWLSGNSTAHASGIGTNTATVSARLKFADWRNFSMQDRAAGTGSIQNLAAKPNGYYPSGAWALASKAGNVANYGGLISMTASGAGALGRNIEGSTTLSLTVQATGQLVVSGAGSFTMSVTASGAIVATRAAVGSFTVSLSAEGELLGKGNMTGTTTLSMTAEATRYATGALAGDFSPNYEFSPDNLARAVWGAELDGYDEPQAGSLLYVAQQILRNKTKTDPATGVMTVYADDGTTVLLTANVYADASGSTPYDGTTGINLKDRLA